MVRYERVTERFWKGILNSIYGKLKAGEGIGDTQEVL